ncbi:Hypothetical protein SRAE_0000062150 [Strongyloides ratti]|uniref:Uncharacterized protein n=1 Tax=Strongyloides ratti TaxID=34506 RepID=A0A090L1Y0_STRRB|nr:Hypothetical protein SRAE_0000062150 [Strongyloides ratti]CEF61499.1 Hypothetical protein SRAE_0000062150 [Strongyloides ratti]
MSQFVKSPQKIFDKEITLKIELGFRIIVKNFMDYFCESNKNVRFNDSSVYLFITYFSDSGTYMIGIMHQMFANYNQRRALNN